MLRHGQAFSPIYRFSLSDGTIVSAHTKSKLVRSQATNEPQLYMSLHILQRYDSLPTPVLARQRQMCCMATCFSLSVPQRASCWLHVFHADGLKCEGLFFWLAYGLSCTCFRKHLHSGSCSLFSAYKKGIKTVLLNYCTCLFAFFSLLGSRQFVGWVRTWVLAVRPQGWLQNP